MYLRLLVVAGSAAFLNLVLSATWQFGGPITPGKPHITSSFRRKRKLRRGASSRCQFGWNIPKYWQEVTFLIIPNSYVKYRFIRRSRARRISPTAGIIQA